MSVVSASAQVGICLLVTTTSGTKTSKPIEMPFALWTRPGPENHIRWGRLFSTGSGNFWVASPGPLWSSLHRICGVRQSYSIGGSSDESFRCQYCSNLLSSVWSYHARVGANSRLSCNSTWFFDMLHLVTRINSLFLSVNLIPVFIFESLFPAPLRSLFFRFTTLTVHNAFTLSLLVWNPPVRCSQILSDHGLSIPLETALRSRTCSCMRVF